jgi:hypothetical protein
MQVKNFEDLEIWKDARLLTLGIYQLTKDSKFSKDFALRGSNREGSGLYNVEHRRGIRTWR